MNLNSISNVLVILPDIIGLNVLSQPALKQILNHHKCLNVDVIGFLKCSEIFNDENIENLVLIDRADVSDAVRKYIVDNGPFELAYDFLSSQETGKILKESGIPKRVGWNYPDNQFFNVPVLSPIHTRSTIYDYLDFLAADGLPCSYEIPNLTVSEAAREAGRVWLAVRGIRSTKLIVMGTGGGNTKKRWPIVNFMNLKHALTKRGFDTLFIVGPMELALRKGIHGIDKSSVIADSLPLNLLMGILSHATCVISNDYAVMHIAGALGIKTVGVFLSSDPNQWFPYRDGSTFVIGEKLDCRPCYSEDCVDWKCNGSVLFDEVHNILASHLDHRV